MIETINENVEKSISSVPDKSVLQHLLSIPVIIAALGYFVDIYDLLLFSIIRIPSLKAIGVPDDQLLHIGVNLINIQMAGLLLGGILWGILGDKKGRLSVLFGSILLYSIANIANGFVHTVTQYGILRFIAGIGLAGELGAGITLVAEILPKRIRGYGTTMVATVGLFGAVLAYFVAKFFDWQMAFWIGGGLGMCLLILRISIAESGMFQAVKKHAVQRGNFLSLFTKKHLFGNYLKCILIGLPIWYVIGILITFSPEFAHALNIIENVNAGQAVMYCYIGLALGDLSSGLISQALKSRKKVVLFFIILTTLSISLYLLGVANTPSELYLLSGLLGYSIGYWALFVTIAAEQFGTNIRATVATTVPNFVRGAVIPITFLFEFLQVRNGMIVSAWIVGAITVTIALLALWKMKETFHNDLDFVEE